VIDIIRAAQCCGNEGVIAWGELINFPANADREIGFIGLKLLPSPVGQGLFSWSNLDEPRASFDITVLVTQPFLDLIVQSCRSNTVQNHLV
jgi:hypothetical protein